MSGLKKKLFKVTKPQIFKITGNIFLTFLLLSPLFIFLGGMYLYQLSFSVNKDPFVQFSGYDPRSEVVIAWETKDLEDSFVWYGISKSTLNMNVTDSKLIRIHKIILINLQPDTEYFYQVGSIHPSLNLRSQIFTFKTAPNNTVTDFNIIVYSDSQQFIGIGWHKRICNTIAKHDQISFVANIGDLCQNWDYKPDWNQFFKESSIYMKKYLFVPCLGNHDGFYHSDDPDGSKHYYKQYFNATFTNNRFYYSFNWSNTQFIVGEISTTQDENINLPENIQHDLWLNQTLINGQSKRFRILMFHRQVFSSEGNNDNLISRIIPIVEKYNVSLVLYGHHHHYERFIFNNKTYICLGGGGGQQFGSNYFKTTPYTESFALGPSYTKLSFTSSQIQITSFSAENDILDNCIII